MNQTEPLDLSTTLNSFGPKRDGRHFIGNEQARCGAGEQVYAPFPDNWPSNIALNHVSSLGLGKRTANRRVARVQPQKGKNIRDQGCISHEMGKIKTVKTRARKKPSFARPILPITGATASQQEMLKPSHLKAKTQTEDINVDGKSLLIGLFTGQAVPRASNQQSDAHSAVAVQSACQNISVQNVCKLSPCAVATGNQTVIAPGLGLDSAGNVNSISILPLNQRGGDSISCNQIDHNFESKIQEANPHLYVDRSHEPHVAKQLPSSVDQRIHEFGHFATYTVENDAKTPLSYNQQKQVESAINQNNSFDETLLGNNLGLTLERHHQPEKKKTVTERKIRFSNEMQIQGTLGIERRENMDAHISLRPDNNSREPHINQVEQISSGTNQLPTFNDCFRPVVSKGDQRPTYVPHSLATTELQVQHPPDRQTSTNVCISTIPQNHVNEQNGDLRYVICNGKKDGRPSSCFKDSTLEEMKRKNLTFFNSLGRNEKTAVLCEKYADLLKRRRRQLKKFDPNYKISLKRMNNVSSEIKTLSKMTKLNCPPRPSRMVKNNPCVSKCHDYPRGTLGPIASLDAVVGINDNEQSAIDLTGNLPPLKIEDTQHFPEDISRKRCSRLPSYEEAIASKAKEANSMSALARRLLSSSQEFFKSLHGPSKGSDERVHTLTKKLNENSTNSTATLLLFSDSPATGAKPIKSAKHLEDATIGDVYSTRQNYLLATENLELPQTTLPSATVFPQSTNGRSGPIYGTAHNIPKEGCPLPCLGNTSIREVKYEDMTPPESVMKSDHNSEGGAWPSLCPSDLPSRKDKKVDNYTTSTQADSPSVKTEIVYLGSEKHTLKNAVVRIEDFRKQLTRRKKKTENFPQIKDEKKDTYLELINRRQKQNPQTHSNGQQAKKKGWAGRSKSISASDDQSSNCSSPSRHDFQDFVPTILPTRTRTAASVAGLDHSSHVLAMELLQQDLDDAINDKIDAGVDVDKDCDEDYSPQHKHVKRHHVRRKRSSSNQSGDEVDDGKEAEMISGTLESDSKSDLGSSLRVEIGKNAQNHIKLKFVNLRSICYGSSSEGTPSHRTQKRSRKNKDKPKHKVSALTEVLKDHTLITTHSSCENDLKTKASDNNVEVNTHAEMKAAKADSAKPDLPLGMKKLIINRKRGETILHRAAKLGNMEILRHCIDNGIEDVNVRDNAGYTSLHDSCVPGHLDVARFLLNNGADVNAEANDGTRPINDAVENNHVALVRLLLAHGADPFHPKATGQTCIEQALDQSSEMKSLIFGYLEEMKVERRNTEEDLGDWVCRL